MRGACVSNTGWKFSKMCLTTEFHLTIRTHRIIFIRTINELFINKVFLKRIYKKIPLQKVVKKSKDITTSKCRDWQLQFISFVVTVVKNHHCQVRQPKHILAKYHLSKTVTVRPCNIPHSVFSPFWLSSYSMCFFK